MIRKVKTTYAVWDSKFKGTTGIYPYIATVCLWVELSCYSFIRTGREEIISQSASSLFKEKHEHISYEGFGRPLKSKKRDLSLVLALSFYLKDCNW